MSIVSEAIHNHHQEISATLRRHVEQIIKGSASADPGALVAFLKHDLLPHAAGEERYLYPAVDPLVKTLVAYDRDEVRSAAARALGSLGDTRAVAPLLWALESPDGRLRAAAAQALGLLGNPQALAPLVQSLGDGVGDVRLAAAQALEQLGDPLWATFIAGRPAGLPPHVARHSLGGWARYEERPGIPAGRG